MARRAANTKGLRGRSRKRRWSPKKRTYVEARGAGLSIRRASRFAGMTTVRGLNGVTGAEWERDPEVAAEIERLRHKNFPVEEIMARFWAEALGVTPTKSTWTEADGWKDEFDRKAAKDSIARATGLFKDGIPPPPPPARIEHSVAGMTDEELVKIVRGAGEALGLVPAHE